MPTIEQVSSDRLTTIAAASGRQSVVTASTVGAVRSVMRWSQANGVSVVPIGAGSNLLLGPLPSNLVLLRCAIRGIRFDGTRVYVGGAEPMQQLVRRCTETGLSGTEWMVSIPGTPGGAAVMNAGAMGACFADIVDRIECIDTFGSPVVFEKGDYESGLRWSNVDPGRVVVTSVVFNLAHGDRDNIRSQIAANRQYRARVHPTGRTMGSVFGGPFRGSEYDGPSPGLVIEAAGLKGAVEGGAMVSTRHANWIVNTGSATFDDVVGLMGLMSRGAKSRGVSLAPEVRLFASTAALRSSEFSPAPEVATTEPQTQT